MNRSQKYPLQLDVTLGQETYTPRALFNTNLDKLERPYAWYVFLTTAISRVKERQLFSFKMELGLAGEQSKAREFQVAYHELIGEFIPIWSGQIANSSHVNGYEYFVKDYAIPKSFFVKYFSLQSTAALGTRRIFAKQEATLFIGDREEVGKTSAFNRLGVQREFYGFGGVGVKFVALNALIEGHPFGDQSLLILPAKAVMYSLQSRGLCIVALKIYIR